MHTLSLKNLIMGLQQKSFSSYELVQHYINSIERQTTLNALIAFDPTTALEEALLADKTLSKGEGKTLTGIPLAHKDLFCTPRLATTCGSKMLTNFYAPYSATVVEKMAAHGGILLAKTNMDEFAMGSSNETSFFGPVKNPWNHAYVAGGSSGGSAAAVAARLIPFATASDTGGSIRQPAAFCGISGIKPTYGLVSRFGMVAYASSLDQGGVMAPSAEDLAILLEVIAGFDPKDSTSIDTPIPNYSALIDNPLKPLRIGLPKSLFHPQVAPGIQDALTKALAVFKSQGAQVVELDISLESSWIPTYYVIACAEASSNLARYDGIRFGHRASDCKNIRELIMRSRSEGFGVEVKRRILLGTHLLSSGYFDAYYTKAQKVRRLIANELNSFFSNVDVIIGPTTPSTAFVLNAKIDDPVERYLADIFTVGANLAGLPAMSIPAGFDTAGLPIGMQLMGAPFSETTLLRTAHAFQQATDWHQQCPDNKEQQ